MNGIGTVYFEVRKILPKSEDELSKLTRIHFSELTARRHCYALSRDSTDIFYLVKKTETVIYTPNLKVAKS